MDLNSPIFWVIVDRAGNIISPISRDDRLVYDKARQLANNGYAVTVYKMVAVAEFMPPVLTMGIERVQTTT